MPTYRESQMTASSTPQVSDFISGLAACLVVVGCAEKVQGVDSQDTATEGPTWHQDIAPLVVEHCSGCHR